ncbi:MAG: Gfo/Idh/MocA family oxidoreductase [Planctomycetales bacterium]|nr:Gfo/Idh/MocA family oxidoreductase [Planctomycetales bacterium]
MSGLPRVLIVGVGSIGERHLRCFAHTRRVALSICESNRSLLQTIAARYAVADAYESYEDALNSAPDMVVICTPAHLHIAMAQQAVEREAAVLIEKPLSTSNEGIERLRATVEQRQVTVAVAYVYRCHPALQAMRQAILQGRFGEPLSIVAQSGQHFPLYRPAYREIYYNQRETGGGAVQDALTHVINAGEWLVGRAERLVADIAHQCLDGVEVEDTAHVLVRHGRVLGCYSLNQYQAPNESTISVVCSQGTARFEFHRNRWRWMTAPGDEWHDETLPPLERDELFQLQAEAFLDAVAAQTPPLCTLHDAQQTLAVNLAILRSAEQLQWQTL